MSIGFTANAQKLPNVQQAGLYAPANVKVDGKTTEWDNKFQAYNKNTSLFYTIANNADNLFLVVQATSKIIVDKITRGGITLILSNSKDKNLVPVLITMPILPNNKQGILGELRKTPTDSVLLATNKQLAANYKEIKLKGISAIPDSAISVYNEYGIKASAVVDINSAYTFEFAIPLKYLSSVINSSDVNYHILLNAVKFTVTRVMSLGANGQVTMLSPAESAVAMANFQPGPEMSELMSTTDFSGNYTLIKK